MDVNRTIRVILEKEDIKKLLNGETIHQDGFEIRPGYDVIGGDYFIKKRDLRNPNNDWPDIGYN